MAGPAKIEIRTARDGFPPFTAEDAAEYGLNLSGLDAEAIDRAVKQERARRWREENVEAIASVNRWVEEHGLPLARYRMF